MEQLIDQAPALRDAGVIRIDIDAADGGALSGKVGATPIADPHPGEVAYLQYTSGSTIEPRGVMVTHANLLAATTHAARAFEVTASSRLVSWLPHYHDMGLAGIILQTIASGCQSWLMSPLSFASKPDRWLSAISRYQATHAGGPDSAYELCARRAASAAAGLRLGSWRCAFTGAEPVHIDTLERFTRAFAPSGFKMAQFCPTYGLAEATAQVTGGPIGFAPRTRAFPIGSAASTRGDGESNSAGPPRVRSTSVVSCGRSWLRTTVRIVDPVTRELVPAGAVGEIWIRGPQVAAGYFDEPVASRNVFGATLVGSRGPAHLRSGDLGAVVDGELFVLGRLKDAIILNGVNHQPAAIEQAVLRHASDIRAGSLAAIGSQRDGRERLVVLVEERPDIASEVARRIRDAIFEELDLTVHLVAFVPVGAFPRTTSGKIKRAALREAFAAGQVPILSEG
jgi:acyl-CoA synthetase (AMP-forming)/AMP-acid ligase II